MNKNDNLLLYILLIYVLGFTIWVVRKFEELESKKVPCTLEQAKQDKKDAFYVWALGSTYLEPDKQKADQMRIDWLLRMQEDGYSNGEACFLIMQAEEYIKEQKKNIEA